ncbi:hypothetical protein HY947_05050 [Candidatus Gottesmanbacteria bacterium]|nr:hypothetical protein [Candidatus Gottesmanbacteria bacterium]
MDSAKNKNRPTFVRFSFKHVINKSSAPVRGPVRNDAIRIWDRGQTVGALFTLEAVLRGGAAIGCGFSADSFMKFL